ncbi:MAG TPA: hypothetical protein VI698_05570 [Nitrososphaerales archaeon]|nr:hypothetical protein [Nitrososphaerales archaeon]
MNKSEILAQMKGFWLALLGVAVGSVVLLTTTARNGESSLSSNISIFVVLLLLWLLVTTVLGIVYLASQASKVIKPIPLRINWEEE